MSLVLPASDLEKVKPNSLREAIEKWLETDPKIVQRVAPRPDLLEELRTASLQARQLRQETLLPPSPPAVPLREMLARQSHASAFFEQMKKRIKSFEDKLDPQQQVAMRLVSFGITTVFQLEEAGCVDPALIWFTGTTEDGQPVELIQHYSQVNVYLMAVPLTPKVAARRPIGFHAILLEDEPLPVAHPPAAGDPDSSSTEQNPRTSTFLPAACGSASDSDSVADSRGKA